MACTSGTVSTGGQPAARATRLAALVWSHAQEARIKAKRGAGLPGVPSQGGNKPRALDDQVRLL